MKLIKLLSVLLLSLSLCVYAGDTININTADKEMLMQINGVGEKLADKIIAYRDENGAYKSVDELMNIKGIGESLIEKNKAMITVDQKQ